MAKRDAFREAQKAGLVADDANVDDFTEAQLNDLLGRGGPEWEGSMSSSTPLKTPDGHETLTAADIKARG